MTSESKLHRWETVYTDTDADYGQYTQRMQVPGGWLYKYNEWAVDDDNPELPVTTRLVSLVFVPKSEETTNAKNTPH